MNATGISKQERKIADMAKVVLDLNATLNPLSAKGAFRFAIAECLTEHGYADWRDVSGKNPAVRKTFFDCIRSKAIPKLVNLGFPKEKSAELERRLDEINRTYLAA